jgi:hypothetical protein
MISPILLIPPFLIILLLLNARFMYHFLPFPLSHLSIRLLLFQFDLLLAPFVTFALIYILPLFLLLCPSSRHVLGGYNVSLMGIICIVQLEGIVHLKIALTRMPLFSFYVILRRHYSRCLMSDGLLKINI